MDTSLYNIDDSISSANRVFNLGIHYAILAELCRTLILVMLPVCSRIVSSSNYKELTLLRRSIVLVFLFVVCISSSIPPTSQAYVPPLSAFGVNSHIASRYGNYAVMEWPADVIAGSGAGWAREDFHWFWIEPEQGRFQWDYYDRMVDLMTSRGINIIGVLGHPPGWATPEPSDAPTDISFYAPDPHAFTDFAAAVVHRYRYRIVHWEIWNEPDNPNFWLPQPDPIAYGQLLSTVYPVIKAVAPEANVLLGGVNPFDPSYLQTIAEIGAWWAFDIINIHPYVDPGRPEDHGEIGIAAISNIQTVTDWAGGKPIWVTEYGWSSRPSDRDPAGQTDEEEQANYLVRGAVLLRAAGVWRVLWYSIKDETQNGYGMMRFAGNYDDYSQPRPAYSAFVVLNQQLAAAQFERRLDEIDIIGGESVYAIRFVNDSETVDVIWALKPSTILLPTAHTEAEVVSRDGHRWTVTAENGALRLYPDERPIYLRQPR